jgi:cephalosporin hydroxylase
MRITIDTQKRTLEVCSNSALRTLPLYSPTAFEVISDIWLKTGWDQKYSYTFTWLGRPIIQLPEDLLRMQEVLFQVQPDVIIETGVAHGGSLIFYATLCRALGKGRVIGIDIRIRPENRKALEAHPLAPDITLIEESSTAPETLAKVSGSLQAGDRVLVVLDSCHTKAHVLAELEAYQSFVSAGSYIVATDGIMKDLHDLERGKPEWVSDNPVSAALEFAKRHPEFRIEQPPWMFNESQLSKPITYWPSSFLKRWRD